MTAPDRAERVAALLHAAQMTVKDLARMALFEVCRTAGCTEDEFRRLAVVVLDGELR